ncbi:MAG: sugar transferase [Cyclobacteriaceae bacterium]
MRSKKQPYPLIITDYLLSGIVWVIFYYLRKLILGEQVESFVSVRAITGGVLIGVFWVFIYALAESYHNVYRNSRIGEFIKLFLSTTIGVIVVFFVFLLDDEGVDDYTLYYETVGTYFLLQFLIIFIARLLFLTYYKELLRSGKVYFNTLLIGAESNAETIFKEVEEINYTLGNRFIGFVNGKNKSPYLSEKMDDLGGYKELIKITQHYKVEQVIIALEKNEHKKIESILSQLAGLNIRIQITPDVYQTLLGSVTVEHIFAVPLVEVKQTVQSIRQRVLKRVFDALVSLFILIIGIPVFLSLAIITAVTSKGPIFFLQERIGKNNVPFQIIKFRSMFCNSENGVPLLSYSGDPRVTKWGRFMRKTRLDESPQFLNVLLGHMSLVGPRPERRYFIDQIIKEVPHYNHLLSVKPGITSLGQVKYGYAQNVEEMIRRMKYDIIYIENMSLTMDLRIIFFTIPIILKGTGK